MREALVDEDANNGKLPTFCRIKMNVWSPQTFAAWWGAVVSTLVAANAVMSRRPVVSLRPEPAWAHEPNQVRLHIENLGPTPLLIRRI